MLYWYVYIVTVIVIIVVEKHGTAFDVVIFYAVENGCWLLCTAEPGDRCPHSVSAVCH